MPEQPSLLNLFEQQFATAFKADDPAIQNPKAAPQTKIQNEHNPFVKKFGACCGQENVRVFECHVCGKTPGCWECFVKHPCPGRREA